MFMEVTSLSVHPEAMDPLIRHFQDTLAEGLAGQRGFAGMLLLTDRQTGQLSVISPMVGTPAYDAGVLAGDVIVKIDDKPTENMRLSEAVEMIQGEPGTPITLTVLHEGAKEPVDLPMKRAEIEVQSVMGDIRKPDNPKEWDYLIDRSNQIGYVRLVNFSKTSAQELRAVLEQLEKDGVRGFVLDLRNNPGGLLRAAVEISDLFLDEGVIVSTKGRNHRDEVYRAKGEDTLLNGPGGPVPMANPRYGLKKLGSCGVDVADCRNRIVSTADGVTDCAVDEVGELVTQNPGLAKGFWKLPDVTAQKLRDRWLHTGDLMRRDRDGYYYFVGRKDDMINVAGENLYPKEVEDVLLRHPGLKDACVVPAPHATKGEAPVAYVVARDPAAPPDEDEVKRFFLERGAPYAHPRRVFFLEKLPLGGTGKLDRTALKRLAAQLPPLESHR